MTVIAYKDGVMACDSCWQDVGTLVSTASKIKRLRSGALYGAAGDSDDRAIMALLEDVHDADSIPPYDVLRGIVQDLIVILVLPDGECWRIGTGKKNAEAYRVDRPTAIGSGADFAHTAMHLGKTAAEACQVACDLQTGCRPPIHVLTLTTEQEST